MSLRRTSPSFVIALFLALPFVVVSSEAVDAPGGEAPGPSTAGTLDIGRWRGRVVLLDFWASWCGPCRESFPWMAEMASRYGSEGLVVVTVNLDQDRRAAERFLEGRRFECEAVYDPEGRLAEKWGIESMPASILFDREGSEAFRHMGFRQEDTAAYEAHIRELLARGRQKSLAGPAPDSEPARADATVVERASVQDRTSEQPPADLSAPGDRLHETESPDGVTLVQSEPEKGEAPGRGDGKIGARPWERACLARPAMRFDGAPLDLSFDEHIYFSREASSGGRGFGGGGCGCN